MTKFKQLLQRISLTVLVVFLFFVTLEIILRLTSEKKEVNVPIILRYSENPKLLYELVPETFRNMNGINITINSKGMRDYEINFEKPKNVYRVALLGDSIPLGIELNVSDTFPKVLEAILNKNSRYKKFEVLNFAVPGYGTKEEAEVLKTKAMKFSPDVVVVSYVLNDPEISTSLQSYFSQHPKNGSRICKINFLNLAINCELKDFIDSLYVSEFIYSKALNMRSRLNEDYYTRAYKDEILWKNVVDSFAEIKGTIKTNRTKVVVVIFPLLYDNLTNYRWKWIHDMIKNEGEKNGFQVLDLLDTYKKFDINDLKSSKKDILHFNKNGHIIAAEEIYIFLAKNGLIN